MVHHEISDDKDPATTFPMAKESSAELQAAQGLVTARAVTSDVPQRAISDKSLASSSILRGNSDRSLPVLNKGKRQKSVRFEADAAWPESEEDGSDDEDDRYVIGSKNEHTTALSVKQEVEYLDICPQWSIASMKSMRSSMRSLGAQEEDQDEDAPHPKQTLRDVNLIYVMPFFCTIATRLPFIYFVIELKETYGLEFGTIGLIVGAFHLCRAFAIAGTAVAPMTAHVLGTAMGVCGYTMLLFAKSSEFQIFACGNIVVGFAEASAAVFVYSKQVYSQNIVKLRSAMRIQSTIIGVAVILGFSFGGMLFQGFGVRGIAVAGITVLALEASSLLYFVLASPNAGGNALDDDQTKKEAAPSVEDMVAAVRADKPRQTILAKFSERKKATGRSNTFTYLIAAIISVEAIACGYLFSIGPLYIFETFHVPHGTIGIIFSCASLFGSIMTIVAISSKGRKLQQRFCRSPYNLYVLILVMTAAIFGALVPIFVVHAICIFLLISSCELFLTLIGELQGTITTSQDYAVLGPSAQMLRRVMNVAMAVTGPIAYGVFPSLPYLIAGLVCTLYLALFFFFTERQQRNNLKQLKKVCRFGLMNSASFKVRSPMLDLSEQEVMARMAEDCKIVKHHRRGSKSTEMDSTAHLDLSSSDVDFDV